MYAIVSTGGKQYRVAEGDVLEVNRLRADVGGQVELPVLLVVDGEQLTTDKGRFTVRGEVVEHTKGPKIDILKYKNKTGYKRRMGHRQQLTRVRVTGIAEG